MKPNKRPDPNQILLNWDANGREERKIAIRAIDWERTTLTRKRWANAVDVLCDLIGRDHEGMFPRVGTIAESCRMDPRTVKRTTRDLRDLGIVVVKRRGSMSNRYTIDAEKLFAIGVDVGTELSHQKGQIVPSEGTDCPFAGDKLSLRHIEELTLTEHQPTSSSTATKTEEEEAVELFKQQVRRHTWAPALLDEAVDTALKAGCTIEQLRARARWFVRNRSRFRVWENGEWRDKSAGAFYFGISRAKPGMLPDEGWPSNK